MPILQPATNDRSSKHGPVIVQLNEPEAPWYHPTNVTDDAAFREQPGEPDYDGPERLPWHRDEGEEEEPQQEEPQQEEEPAQDVDSDNESRRETAVFRF